jgi:hypothetical protein
VFYAPSPFDDRRNVCRNRYVSVQVDQMTHHFKNIRAGSIRAVGLLVRPRRQGEAESRATVGRFIVGSNVSTMRFDDGARNGQAQSQAGDLGREKTVKEVIEMLRLDAGAAVFESAAQGGRIEECGLNNKRPARSSDLRHRLDRVDRQVDEHLLKLRAVSEHFRCRRIGVMRDYQPMCLNFVPEKQQGLADDLVDRQ